jgi:hypothetical protein
MPRLGCTVGFPQLLTGAWKIESPVGEKIFEQSFDGVTTLSTEQTIGVYSAYILVDTGLSIGGTPVGAERIVRQNVSVIITPGISTELSQKFKESPAIIITSGAGVVLHNKLRTVVSVSVS